MKRKDNQKYQFFWPMFFLLPFCICFFAFNLYPMLYSLYMSFLEWNGFGNKSFVGLQNYINIFTKDTVFWSSLWNTIKIGIIGFPISIILGLILAAMVYNLKWFRNTIQTVYFLPYITTPVAIGMLFTFIFEKHIGFLNRLITVCGGNAVNFIGSPKWAPLVVASMIIWKSTGYYMSMFLAGMTAISEDINEAALLDGANKVQIFFKITIPMLKQVTTFIVITSIIAGLQLFDEANLLFTNQSTGNVGGPGQSCLTMVWNFYNQAFGANPRMGYASALSSVLFVLIVIISIISLKLMNRKEK